MNLPFFDEFLLTFFYSFLVAAGRGRGRGGGGGGRGRHGQAAHIGGGGGISGDCK